MNDIEAKYYADGEDAFDMRKDLNPKPSAAAQKADQQKQRQVSWVQLSALAMSTLEMSVGGAAAAAAAAASCVQMLERAAGRAC